MDKISYKFIKQGLEKHANDSAFEGNGWCRVWVQEDEIAAEPKYAEILKMPDEATRVSALKDLAREIAHESLRMADSAGAKVGVQSWFDSLTPSDHDRIDWVSLATPQQVTESKQASDFEKGISQNKDASAPKKCEVCNESFTPAIEGQVYCSKDCGDDDKIMTDEASLGKQADEPTVAPKTQYKDYKITPKYTPKEQAIPADAELGQVLAKMESLQTSLATLEEARKKIQADMQAEMEKVDSTGERAGMEAELQQSIEKAAVLIDAVESKVVQWKDKLYTMQTEEVKYVPKITPKEMLSKIYAKFNGAEKYVQDVLNGMLAQGKNVMEKTLIQWPNKKSELSTEADSSPLAMMNHFNDELMAALQELSSPL